LLIESFDTLDLSSGSDRSGLISTHFIESKLYKYFSAYRRWLDRFDKQTTRGDISYAACVLLPLSLCVVPLKPSRAAQAVTLVLSSIRQLEN
jgi:hypothetical protein